MPPPHGRYNILRHLGLCGPIFCDAEHNHRFYQRADRPAVVFTHASALVRLVPERAVPATSRPPTSPGEAMSFERVAPRLNIWELTAVVLAMAFAPICVPSRRKVRVPAPKIMVSRCQPDCCAVVTLSAVPR